MHTIGFSTGALAHGDFRNALAMLVGKSIHAVELSALRESEVEPLFSALSALNLSQFSHIAVHVPSSLTPGAEAPLIELIHRHVIPRNWPVVVHPDIIQTVSLWRTLGPHLLLENMDHRKPIGRTYRELAPLFDELPEAGFCLDLGHARQIDPTMEEATCLLQRLGHRLLQVHLSDVNPASQHDPLNLGAILMFNRVAHLIPDHIPIILETPVREHQMLEEIAAALEVFSLELSGAING